MIETALRLQKEGYSTALIGERLGVGKNAVVGKLRRLRCRAEGRPAHSAPAFRMPTQARNYTEPVAPPNPAERYTAMGTEAKPCEFPTGDRRSFTICGENRVVGKPFCPDHCATSYIKVRPYAPTVHSAARRQAAVENAARIEEALCR